MQNWFISVVCLITVLVLGGCATSGAHSQADKRQAIQAAKQEVLGELYRSRPGIRSKIAGAPGYAVFSNANINLILASFGGGEGVVTGNHSDWQTCLKMVEAGIGLGLGVKDFRAVFVFHNRDALEAFIESGWEFGAHADPAAKANEKGAAVGGEGLLYSVTVYRMTESGLALQVTLKSTRYWRDTELN
jgi:lipid-binding SYLF domain-containing protein